MAVSQLRRVLDRVRLLSIGLLNSPSSSSALSDLRSFLDCFSVEFMGLKLPEERVAANAGAPVLYAKVAEASSMHASLFGFRDEEDTIPLHDHPEMHGFIRVLRGALRVTSFSPLPSNPSRYRFDGTSEVRPSDGCVYLSPSSRNIHEVRALEAGTFFFDLLVPGYKELPCSYYSAPKSLPLVGSEVELERCPIPPTYFCVDIPFCTFFLDDVQEDARSTSYEV